MQLKVEGSTGTLTSNWNFSSSNPRVAVNGASFTDPSGQTTALPDSNVDLRCGSSGTINDWAATYSQDYSCLPRETGQATLTITVTGPDTIAITDEDPPGSGIVKTYAATIISCNPHAVRGFFIGGPAGNRYREDFNWTLGKNGSGFSQILRLQVHRRTQCRVWRHLRGVRQAHTVARIQGSICWVGSQFVMNPQSWRRASLRSGLSHPASRMNPSS